MVAYHDFEGITIHADEAPRLLKSIGDKPAVILRNHGLLAWGRTLPLAFVRLWTLQRACEIQVAQAALGPAIPVPEAVAQQDRARLLQFDQRFGAGQDVFDALVRQVDRIDDGLRKSHESLHLRRRRDRRLAGRGAGAGRRDVSVVARGATLEALQRTACA